jgi:hypothetical protein
MPAEAAAEDTFTLTFQDQEVLAVVDPAELFKVEQELQEAMLSAAAEAAAQKAVLVLAADQE